MSIDRDGEGPPLRRPGAGADKTGGGEADGLRAQPFTDDVFDDDYYSRRGRTGGGRSFGLVVGVIFGIAIAAGAGWYILEGRGGLGIVANGEPVEVKADPSPYKTKPANPGGMQVANQDKLVYERVARGEAEPRVENLLPPAETPKAPPPKPQQAPQAETPAPVQPAAPEPAPQTEAKPVEAAQTETPAAETPKPAAPAPETARAPVAAAPEVDPLAQAVAAAAPGRVSATGTAPGATAAAPPQQPMSALVPEPAAPVAAPQASPQQVAALPAAGAFQVQLAAARSEEAAAAEWSRLSARHKDLLGGMTHNVLRADLGERGVFFRLRAGPVADQAAADQLCAALAAQNVPCLVIKP